MNKKLVLFVFLFFAMAQLWSQSNKKSRIPLLGEQAPVFTAQSTKGTINFPTDYAGKWKILFSHPADFTPVCTSELIELARMQQDFKDLDVALVVVSTNNLDLHRMWVKSMEDMIDNDYEHVKIDFPLVDDSKLNIGLEYGMLTPSHESFKAVRGVFIIDPQNKIRSITFYPMNVGRNMQEIKRMMIALETSDKNSVLIPANWEPGKDVLLPYLNAQSYNDVINSQHSSKTGDQSEYMFYKKLDK